jgi:Uma2 family endonuclease
MAFTIDEAFLPAILTAPPMTDEQFAEFCSEHPDLFFEMTADSSTGYVLPDGARRSPDASWTRKASIRQLSEESREGYWHLCPAFAIELRSKSDRIRMLRDKMREWIANGAELAWLIDPKTRTAEVYRPHCEPEVQTPGEFLAGEGPVEGFVLDLRTVWDPLA